MAHRLATRPAVAALILAAAYATLILLNSDGGYLGTDTGAKAVTLHEMVENGTSSPAVGYWAEEWDPDGDYHPLFDTLQNDDGEWVNVTTLPMLIASRPLYDLGGYRLSLVWPVIGGVLAALACRDIARQLSDERAGWWTFWVVGGASPIAVYSLDLWEHSLGAGLMLAAVALLLRVVRGGPAVLALVAGLSLGMSASMRTETFVVALVAVGATSLVLLTRREVVRALASGALAVAGFAGPWLLNAALEAGVGGNSRTTRVTGEAQREWWTELGERAEEALITWFGLPGAGFPQNAMLGFLAVAALVAAAVASRRGEDRATVLLVGVAAVLYVLSLASGLGFVSGALVASPFAACALLTDWTPDRRLVVASAASMTVLIWTFQLIGGAGPQWGGRYILVPTLLFTTLGVVALMEQGDSRRMLRIVTAFSVVVTAFGLVWLHQRSHGVDEFFEDLAAQPEEVVIATNGFLVREAGPAYEDRLYLSIGRQGDVAGAVEVVEDSGHRTFAILTPDPEPDVEARPTGSDRIDFLGAPLWYHRYEIG